MSRVAIELALEPADNERLANLCGQFDEHLRLLERRTGVEIGNRGNQFKLVGGNLEAKHTDSNGKVTTGKLQKQY